MWSVLLSPLGRYGLVLLAGFGAGIWAHDYTTEKWQSVRDYWSQRAVERTDTEVADDQSRIEEKAAVREAEIRSAAGLDADVSVRLECLLRFPDGKGISRCVQKLVRESEKTLPLADPPPH